MLFSDFTASGGVLGVALVDTTHPLLGPDLPPPQHTPSEKFNGITLQNSVNIVTPDLPEPIPTTKLQNSVNIGTPDLPEPKPTTK